MMTSGDQPVGTSGCLAGAFWFVLQFFFVYPMVLLCSLPFLEAMGSPIMVKGPMTGSAYREILLFAGLGLGSGLLVGVFLGMDGHSAFYWAARRLWIPLVALHVFSFAVVVILWLKFPRHGFHFALPTKGLEVFLATLPTVLYITYSLGADIVWRRGRLRRFRQPDEGRD